MIVLKHPRQCDEPLLAGLINDLNPEIRSHAVALMVRKYRPDLIRCKACIPDLIAILRTPEPKQVLTGDQFQAGYAIALNTGKDFHFQSFGACGNPIQSAIEAIGRGRKLGGEEGRAMIEAGQRARLEFAEEDRKGKVNSDAENLAERLKVLKWWDSGGTGVWQLRCAITARAGGRKAAERFIAPAAQPRVRPTDARFRENGRRTGSRLTIIYN